MAARSLTATPDGIEQINRALTEKKWSRDDLAKECDCSRQPAVKFCSGKSVSKKLFVSFCEALELDWEEVVGFRAVEMVTKSVPSETGIKELDPRLQLFDAVKNLSLPEFERLLFVLELPKGIVSESQPQLIRTKELFDWVEGTTGPGVAKVEQVLSRLNVVSVPKQGIDAMVQTKGKQAMDCSKSQKRQQLITKCQQQIVDEKLSVYDFIHCTTCVSLVVYFPANIKEKFRKDFQKIQDDHHTVQNAGPGNLMVQMKRKHFEDGFRLEFLQALEELYKEWSSS